MPLRRVDSFATLLVGSAVFFIVTMTQIFIFGGIPELGDWIQILLIPLVFMIAQYIFGKRFNNYIDIILKRRPRLLLALFVVNWLLFSIPIWIIVVLTP